MALWSALYHPAPFNVGTALLLTDGSVMCQDVGPNASGSPNWWKFTPDPTVDLLHSYVAGQWTKMKSMPARNAGQNSPQYFASAVLKDGRVFVAGGEYNGTSAQANLLAAWIYDPTIDAWSWPALPPTWTQIGDAPCCVLPDGTILVGNSNTNNSQTRIYDPVANSWSQPFPKNNGTSAEESWALLPNGDVLSEDCYGHPATELFDIATRTWKNIGPPQADLVENSSNEIGAAVLLPSGKVFVLGATGATGLYTPPSAAAPNGTWASGPPIPPVGGQAQIAKDAPACLMPNGRVLCAVGPTSQYCNNATDQGYCGPTTFLEYDPVTSAFEIAPQLATATAAPYTLTMLLLPNGQVLLTTQTNDVEIYIPGGSPSPAWAPAITSLPTTIALAEHVPLQGTQLNGLSQACAYGDDASMATNYPLVRVRHQATGHLRYYRTHDHSTMGVATGSTPQSTTFEVAVAPALGACELSVVANGIPSQPVQVTVEMLGLSGPAVFGRGGQDSTGGRKSIYLPVGTATKVGGPIAQVWDTTVWEADCPQQLGYNPALLFRDTPAVLSRGGTEGTGGKKSIYAVTTDGRLVQMWDTGIWNIDFPAEDPHGRYPPGFERLRFQGTPAVFGREPSPATGGKKSIYVITTDGRLVQLWDTDVWNADFPAEKPNGNYQSLPGAAWNVRFIGSPAVIGIANQPDAEGGKKSIYVVNGDGNLVQLWDTDVWNGVFPALQPGGRYAPGWSTRFTGTPAVFGREPSPATGGKKSIYIITSDGRLAQLWDTDAWNGDFPAENTAAANLRFQGNPAVFARQNQPDAEGGKKSVYTITTDGRLVQLWDTTTWHADFPAEAPGANYVEPWLPRFKFSPAVFGREIDPEAEGGKKSIYAVNANGTLVQLWDTSVWNGDFPLVAP